MDKKYNGFNNGRDKSDGVGGREVNHGTQQTMTKEQILMSVPIDPTGTEHFTEKEVIQAMEEYAQQEVAKEREKYEARILETIESMDDIMKEELSKEREKAAKLLKVLQHINFGIDVAASENANYVIETRDIQLIKQSLTEYEKS